MSEKSRNPETDQLEECDQYKVDEDYAEYNAYRRMVEHARTLERERDMARAAANTFRQCAEVTFGVMPFPRKFHWENDKTQQPSPLTPKNDEQN